ncbi:Mediator of RNA polymerase II transcription subunit [Trichinella pseudospiralis]
MRLQTMHSSHMQAEALMGYLGFCIRHLVKSFIWMLHVNEEKRMFKMKRIESAESSSLLFKEILHRYRNYTIIYSVFNVWNGESSVPVLLMQ